MDPLKQDLKNEDGLKKENEDDPQIWDGLKIDQDFNIASNLKNEGNIKIEDNHKNEDNIKK